MSRLDFSLIFSTDIKLKVLMWTFLDHRVHMEHVFQLYKRMWPGIELSKKLHDVCYTAHVLYSFSFVMP